jgi:hypothetical protein
MKVLTYSKKEKKGHRHNSLNIQFVKIQIGNPVIVLFEQTNSILKVPTPEKNYIIAIPHETF